jgi:predicted nucleic acid binding AN1-type Zn finger protein
LQLVFDIFGDIFGTFTLVIIGFFIFVIVIVIIGVGFACRAGSGVASTMTRGFSIEAPSFVIPDRHRGQRRSDGSEMKTVRLPEKCPSCGAAVSQEGIDWTGPLEAKCNYCGGTLRASFESV